MKILYITTISSTMGFFPEHFKMLLNEGHTVEVACNLDEPLHEKCKGLDLKTHHIPFSRSPLSRDNLKALKQLKQLISEGEYDIVHTHTPNASVCARLACRAFRKKGLKVFYTAHGFHFYKGAPIKNWLMYYPIEWLCSFFTDKLITINSDDFKLAKKRMHAKEILYVPGVGIDLSRFGSTEISRAEKRKELGIPEDATVLLSVGELNSNKNHQLVINAIKDMDVYYIIAGRGNKKEELLSQALQMGMGDRFKLLGYRKDINELYMVADAFVFPSIREGLGVATMEAIASGVPCAISRIRGNKDLLGNEEEFLFSPFSVSQCKKAIENVLSADKADIGNKNKEYIKHFSNEAVITLIKDIYNK